MGSVTSLAVVRKEKTPSFADVLKTSTTTTVKKKSTSKVTEIDVPKNIKEDIDRFVEAKASEKKAKAEKVNAEGSIIDFASTEQDKLGFAGDHSKSYKLSGNKSQVTYVTSNRHSLSSEDIEEIRELLGKHYSDLISENTEVKLKAAIFTDEALQQRLMEAVGDSFDEFFETTTDYTVSDDFDRKIYDVIKAPAKLADIRVYCKPYKAALR